MSRNDTLTAVTAILAAIAATCLFAIAGGCLGHHLSPDMPARAQRPAGRNCAFPVVDTKQFQAGLTIVVNTAVGTVAGLFAGTACSLPCLLLFLRAHRQGVEGRL